MKIFKRVISAILTMIFAASVMNFQVFAFKTGDPVEVNSDDVPTEFKVEFYKGFGPPNSITLSPTSCKLKPGENIYISYTMTHQELFGVPENYQIVTWSSSDAGVASISSDSTTGMTGGITVYGVSGGIATISATTKNGITSTCIVTVDSEPTSIEVAPIYAQMQSGETLSLSATVFHADVPNKSVTWSSSDSSVASVDRYGTVTAEKGGTAIITAMTYNGIAESCTINVKSVPASITLNTHNISLEVNKEAYLSYTIDPADVQNDQVTWSSSNSGVASVDRYGTVRGLRAGTATITVTTSNGKSDMAAVTVQNAAPQSVSLSTYSKTMTAGETAFLTATISPADAKDDPVTWYSDNLSAASVDSNGKITAKSAGSANITVTTSNGLTATCYVTVKAVEPASITLPTSSHTMNIGDVYALYKTIKPDEARNDKVTWTSGNTSVATVSNGTVTAKSAGTTTITVKTSNGLSATCEITVKAPEAASVTVSLTSTTLEIGKTAALRATVKPSAASQSVTWSSGDSSVATVSASGIITAKKAGTATITAKTSNGKTASCKVTVKAIEAASVPLSASSKELEAGKSFTLYAAVAPFNTADKSVTWKSSDTSVAAVSNGKVTARSVGTATITVTTKNGKTAACKITVPEKVVASVALNKSSAELTVGESLALTAAISPRDAGNKTLTWFSNNEDIAAVDSSGKVSARSAGKATITAKSANGKIANCIVTVKSDEKYAIKFKTHELTMRVGETKQLEYELIPENIEIEFYSPNNNGCLEIDSRGKITAKKVGLVSIDARIGDSAWDYVNVTIGQSQEDEAASRQKYIEDVLYYVNIEREKAGVAPLELMPELSALAQIRTDEQVKAGDISHIRPDGTDWKTVFNGSGVPHKIVGENLAIGAGLSPKAVVDAWMDSDGHRANILRARFKYMGIGVVFTNSSCKGGYIITQLFTG